MILSPLVRRFWLMECVGRCSDFWHQAYYPAFPVWVADWEFVSSYSSATVADFHGVPCDDALVPKELGRRLEFAPRQRKPFLVGTVFSVAFRYCQHRFVGCNVACRFAGLRRRCTPTERRDPRP
jgi:hypothetical protein